MEISDKLLTVFTATIEEEDDSYIIEIPKQEISHSNIQPNEVYRTAVLSKPSVGVSNQNSEPQKQDQQQSRIPVDNGEQRTVEIEDIGDQGDGITRIESGYVIIVPDTEPGERVTIEITDVQETVAFADVVDRHG